MLSLLQSKFLHKLCGVVLHGFCVSSPPSIDLFNHLFVSIGTHGYLFYRLHENPVLRFIAQVVLNSAIGCSLSLLLCS